MDEAFFGKIVGEILENRRGNDDLAQFGSRISAHQYLPLYRLIGEFLRPGSKVLDWGSGNGHLSYFLVRAGFRTSGYGFDDVPRLCRSLPAEAYVYRRGDVKDPVTIPFGDAGLDAVLSAGVLEHVGETGGSQEASLREIKRILAPGGLFLCYHLPNRYSWIEMCLRLLGRWSHKDRFTAGDIRDLCSRAGMEVLRVKPYAILPRNVWSWATGGRGPKGTLVASLYDGLDSALSRTFVPVCQNYLFVARKPSFDGATVV